MKTLKEVLNYIGIENNCNEEVKGITLDSTKVKKGYIFVALKGIHHNGLDYKNEVLKKGAIAIFNEEAEDINIYKINNLKDILDSLAKYIYDIKLDNISILGIVGTNGKTSVSTIVYKTLINTNNKAMLIGTNGIYYNFLRVETNNTTPDILTIYYYIALAIKNKIKYIIMEISSHGIALNRIKGLKFDIIGLTNISQDHLDFHHTFLDYKNTKNKVLENLNSNGKVIYNKDDEHLNSFNFYNFKPITYGFKNEVDYKISDELITNEGLSFKLNEIVINSKLTSMFNIYNLSLAYIILKLIHVRNILDNLSKIENIEGRMEKYNILNRTIIIDFAHTEDAISNVLSYISKINKNKMIVVFGAGGDRDKTKRPKMLNACLKYTSNIIVTSDNPRYEDPLDIILDVIKNNKVTYFLSRTDAIKHAFSLSNNNDFIVILGKGNEKYQIIKDLRIPYNDFETIKKISLGKE